MVAPERRRTRRFSLSIPLRYRSADSRYPQVLSGETRDLSPEGVYFFSGFALRVGDPIEMFLTMPSEITGRPPEAGCYSARVVHVESFEKDGASGIGAVFLPSVLDRMFYRGVA